MHNVQIEAIRQKVGLWTKEGGVVDIFVDLLIIFHLSLYNHEIIRGGPWNQTWKCSLLIPQTVHKINTVILIQIHTILNIILTNDLCWQPWGKIWDNKCRFIKSQYDIITNHLAKCGMLRTSWISSYVFFFVVISSCV